jgi:hypothetical protein
VHERRLLVDEGPVAALGARGEVVEGGALVRGRRTAGDLREGRQQCSGQGRLEVAVRESRQAVRE